MERGGLSQNVKKNNMSKLNILRGEKDNLDYKILLKCSI